jgi:hypothetical protein
MRYDARNTTRRATTNGLGILDIIPAFALVRLALLGTALAMIPTMGLAILARAAGL